MEQQTVTVSKASIHATLKARTSILASTGPRYGRFDPYEPIGDQIDVHPKLISRFDLIFTLQDNPDEETDRKIANRILTTNKAGEIKYRRRSGQSDSSGLDVDSPDIEPPIERPLIRKYIAYARRNCFPVFTDSARDVLEDFYVDLRSNGTDDDAPVPVSARKLESLVRLSEASAQIRLSDQVEAQDAERAVELTRSSIESIGVDQETGEFDADIVETGTSRQSRKLKTQVIDRINELEAEHDRGAPISEVIDRAVSAGFDSEDVEDEIKDLKNMGEIYEPTSDHIRTI